MELNEEAFERFEVSSFTTPDGIGVTLYCRSCHEPVEVLGDTLEDYVSVALFHNKEKHDGLRQ